MQRTDELSRLWSIILAGGEGKRIGPLIEQWLGHHRPKQYCTFVGTRSMLQHTLDRADQITALDHKITVISRSHRPDALPQLTDRPGRVILQPANRDTVAGIFLPLTYVRSRDPRATVVIYPSDYFVYPEERFLEAVRQAITVVQLLKERVLLLGIAPDGLELDYGWMLPGPDLGYYGDHRIRAVSAFLEKPAPGMAQRAWNSGALWNTFVMVGKVETLWGLGWRCCPQIMQLLEGVQSVMGTEQEDTTLTSVYRDMPMRNFSLDLLQRMPSHVASLEVTDVLWSDWGNGDRITKSLSKIGKQPAFPLAFAKAS